MELVSPDGDQGFPGALSVAVTYEVTSTTVAFHYEATTTAPTVVNLTNHSYLNLDGPASHGVDGHLLQVDADSYLPVTADLLPLGQPRRVAGTPFDLRAPAYVGDRVRADDEQVLRARGIDHHYVVRGTGMRRHARVTGPDSGIRLTVLSDQPGVQVYTGNMLDGTLTGKHGRAYRQGAGLALETQHAPDSPNRPDAPSTVLRPGSVFTSTTLWQFDIQPS